MSTATSSGRASSRSEAIDKRLRVSDEVVSAISNNNVYSDDSMVGVFSSTTPSYTGHGLSNVIFTIFPYAQQRIYSRHLYQNMKAKHPGMLLKLHFWAASQASTESQFRKEMNSIKEIKEKVYLYLNENPPRMWSRHAFDVGARSDHITNNMTESFYHWVGDLRSKPILTLIDHLRMKILDMLHRRYEKASMWEGKVTPRVIVKLKKVQQEARHYRCQPACEDQFEVLDKFENRFVVNLNYYRSSISYIRGELVNYCDLFFTIGKYLDTYKEMIYPLPDLTGLKHDAPNERILPPNLKRQYNGKIYLSIEDARTAGMVVESGALRIKLHLDWLMVADDQRSLDFFNGSRRSVDGSRQSVDGS
ncbi:uncharacterized protein LOC122059074 [Macadamia integrifolia]|uniref:uncharacterized protein LOC122059074 n=1 Tax=Macadamia integrifolia TaxID=60698 RepID=UPI001C52D508|nr:uncharacterized protein LOC122059074 [Macadamia integrifolia]